MSWVAGVCELLHLYLVGEKNRYGFLVGVVCDVLWIIVALMNPEIAGGLLLVVVPALFLNIRNFLKWGREKQC